MCYALIRQATPSSQWMPGQKVEALGDEGTHTQVLLSGAASGLVSRFCIAPLDVVKIRLQLQPHSLSDPLSHPPASHAGPIYKGTLRTLTTILREEGVHGLWKGNVPAEALYLTYGSVQFLTYRAATETLSSLRTGARHDHGLNGAAASFIAGAVAGVTATATTYPLDLLRTRFAAQGTERVYEGLLAGVRDIARTEGAKGFYRGAGAAVSQVVPSMGLFFAFYEAFKPLCAGTHLPLESLGSGEAIAGIMASVLSKTAVFPLDTVRKRLQVQGPTRERYIHRNIPVYDKGVLGTITAILQKEGARGLYRGLPVSLIKAAPASAITMWTYERTMAMLQSWSRALD